jgi:hypothetical protein
MPSLNDVYCKFGEVSEAAQLLETELGTLLLEHQATEEGLLDDPDPKKAVRILEKINHSTLGRLFKQFTKSTDSLADLEELLNRALNERNRLTHSFYRQHNFRKNSDTGRALMLEDLENIHRTILEAYKALMRLSGIDLEDVTVTRFPNKHISI